VRQPYSIGFTTSLWTPSPLDAAGAGTPLVEVGGGTPLVEVGAEVDLVLIDCPAFLLLVVDLRVEVVGGCVIAAR